MAPQSRCGMFLLLAYSLFAQTPNGPTPTIVQRTS